MIERHLFCPIWYCLPANIQAKVRSLAPVGWIPPGEKYQLESLKEIDHLMRQPPSHVKRQASW
ncbi:hypothetical protein btf_871 [Dehalococcoides mccartyi BTF08]|nr:hypothetical protein btf_871 [Dehalococcoides mccartyi BTF08]